MHRLPAPEMPPWLEAMLPEVERYRVDVGDYAMHVMEKGEGLPVVLVHGNPTWGFLYRRVVEALSGSPDLRLIMPDLIGLGFSDKPASAVHQLANHTRWMRRFLEQLELERVVLVVQDWGGAIGVGGLAQLAPAPRAGLVVLNTVLTPPKPGFRATAFHRFSRIPVLSELAFRGLGFPQVRLDLAQGDKSSIRGDVARAYRYPLRRFRDNAAPLALARMVPDGFDHASIEPLRACQRYVEAFDGPAAIVWGDRDPVLGRVRGWMEKLFPDAPVTRTEAGHFLQEEVPGEIAEAIRDVAARM
ncbi:MAG TPA: alpha/beta fold hydrolase [Polyangiaceae bacterium]|nr:alpha/beta fold hydrolase [Polyangiaceae bacterium]